jgi:cell shape-determining protein MreC
VKTNIPIYTLLGIVVILALSSVAIVGAQTTGTTTSTGTSTPISTYQSAVKVLTAFFAQFQQLQAQNAAQAQTITTLQAQNGSLSAQVQSGAAIYPVINQMNTNLANPVQGP